MPNFFAPLSSTSNLVGDIFVLDILPPTSLGAVDYTIGAMVVLDLPKTLIAPQLALQYGAKSEGDIISIGIRQRSFLTFNIHEFEPIPTEIRFAPARLGPNYIQLGLDDLQSYFKISQFYPQASNPSPPFLFFEPKPEHAGLCHELTASGSPGP
jgi:hypothetical protein